MWHLKVIHQMPLKLMNHTRGTNSSLWVHHRGAAELTPNWWPMSSALTALDATRCKTLLHVHGPAPSLHSQVCPHQALVDENNTTDMRVPTVTLHSNTRYNAQHHLLRKSILQWQQSLKVWTLVTCLHQRWQKPAGEGVAPGSHFSSAAPKLTSATKPADTSLCFQHRLSCSYQQSNNCGTKTEPQIKTTVGLHSDKSDCKPRAPVCTDIVPCLFPVTAYPKQGLLQKPFTTMFNHFLPETPSFMPFSPTLGVCYG